MWQWYCRFMCPIMTNGFYVFFRLAGQEGGDPVEKRPSMLSLRLVITIRYKDPLAYYMSRRFTAITASRI